ncbi:hypothetical protein V6N12_002306 [Hibiscus sabdariffa]|uniref:Uncharacterized protein n=1 Tax=Hibiscus sabdariffa TaxID=183260 RepID=A0ABR2B0D9_9ROSI
MSLTVNTTWGLRSHSALRLFLSTAIDEEYSSPILKLNPAILYVQGMNEVLAPIHYAFGGWSFCFQEMLERVSCPMLLCVKSRLLGGDFAANLKLLQPYPDINTEHTFYK